MSTEGSVYQRKDGRWVAQYRDAKDKVRYVYRKTKAEAKKALTAAPVSIDPCVLVSGYEAIFEGSQIEGALSR